MSSSRQSQSYLKTSFDRNGYVIACNVLSEEQCDLAIAEAQKYKQISGFFSKENLNKDKKTLNSPDQFNKVGRFFDSAYSNNPELNEQSMIKIGHAMHKNPLFDRIVHSRTIERIQKQLEVIQQLVVQSMVLEKLPTKGGKVPLHQDSTYLLNQPETIKGYWIPLSDVDQQNGCVWVIPGSHQGKLYKKFRIVNGMPMEQNQPQEFQEKQCIPLRMNKGDLLIMSGRLLHKSEDNLSEKTRYAFTWHTMNKSSQWSPQNWLSMEEIQKYQ